MLHHLVLFVIAAQEKALPGTFFLRVAVVVSEIVEECQFVFSVQINS